MLLPSSNGICLLENVEAAGGRLEPLWVWRLRFEVPNADTTSRIAIMCNATR
jgi:hypothetical protein